MQPRAVFVDVDGTLVGAQGTIPESAVKAIRDSRAAGNLVFLATGRSTDELWDELLEIGFDGQITGSGATVEIPGETLTKVRFTPEQVDRLERDLSATGAILMYHTDTGSITSAAGQEWLRQMVRERHGDSDQSTHFGFIDFLLIDQDPRLASVSKTVYFDSSLLSDQVQELLGPEFVVVSGSVLGNSGEISPAGVTKATGVELVLKHFGLPRETSVALGDSFNDLEMLRYAGVGIAMGQAAQAVQEAADEITGSPDEGGVAAAFRRHGLLD